MSSRVITVTNKSGTLTAYYLVNAGNIANDSIDEDVSDSGGDTTANQDSESSRGVSNHGIKPWACVYQASQVIKSPSGSYTFQLDNKFKAICGRGPRSFDVGVKVFANDSEEASIATATSNGTRLTMTIPPDSEPSFDRTAPTQNTLEIRGAFGIAVDHSFSLPAPSVGASAPFDQDDIVPLCIWEAQPGGFFPIKYQEKWYVVQGTAKAHSVTNVTNLHKTPVIDFENEGKDASSAHVTHKDNGTFAVVYR